MRAVDDRSRCEPIASDSKSVDLFKLAKKVAASDVSVLISGESGTGKEVLAQYIHHHSSRAEFPFVAINCAAIPENMLEAVLFGYEKGAFTGAFKSMPGKFEQANFGTLLLDEITEMGIGLQAKILRVLQEHEVERLGSTQTISLNVRIIATTNRDLKEAVKTNIFREDLYYRLNVFPLHWMPLRERKGDILPMALYLIEKHSHDFGIENPVLSDAAKNRLLNYPWPGNARELENVIQRSLILHTNHVIAEDDIVLDIPTIASSDFAQQKKQHEYELINQVLQESAGNRKKAAEILAISERTLRYKLAEMKACQSPA